MAEALLNNEEEQFSFGKEQKVIINDLGDIAGGRTLDTTDYTDKFIKAGHIIIKKSSGAFAPLGLTSGGAYKTLASGESYVGVLKATIKTAQPMAAILTIGQVNKDVCPVAITSAIEQGLPRIQFM
ncbi:MAG: hypothetical protein J6T78_04480 [Bacteroidaceae bacterium]|nr:hypothetical protein [Bacteroidaceae bacterium]